MLRVAVLSIAQSIITLAKSPGFEATGTHDGDDSMCLSIHAGRVKRRVGGLIVESGCGR